MVYQINIFMYSFSIILLILLESTFQSGENSSEQKAFRSVFHFAYIYFVLEIIWNIIDGRDIAFGFILNYTVCILKSLISSILGFKWFCYFMRLTNPTKSFSLVFKIFIHIPIVIFGALIISTFATKWIFYIDDKNFYERGMYSWINIICSFFYVVLVIISALISLRKKITVAQKKRYIIVASYSLFPLLTLIYLLFDSSIITMTQLGVVLSITCVFVNIQQQKITRDGLTMLNNRASLYKFMDDKVISYPEEREDLHLILIDVINFHNINKSFGHVEGDITICKISDILKNACSSKRCFLARYSGDVFAIVCSNMTSSDIDLFITSIKSKLEKIEIKNNKKLQSVINYSEYNQSYRNIKEWISNVQKLNSSQKYKENDTADEKSEKTEQ